MLERACAALAAERRAGANTADHGTQLAVIGLTLEDLADLRRDAEAEGATARAQVDETNRRAALADQALARTGDKEFLSKLVVHGEAGGAWG